MSMNKLSLEAIIISEGSRKVAARCVEEFLIYDYKANTSTTFRPEQIRDLTRIYKRQAENRELADNEIDGLMKRLISVEIKVQNLRPPGSAQPDEESPEDPIDLPLPKPTQPSEERPKDPAQAMMEGRRLHDVPLKPEAVESAIDDALRATGDLEPEINEEPKVDENDHRDAEVSEGSKPASNSSGEPKEAKDTVSESKDAPSV